MSNDSVGIAIPFYRDLGYLRAAIESLLGQTDGDFTAVVIDDSPVDVGADDVVSSFADPRISYRRNAANLGVALNFNLCLESTGTDLVSIFHADDLLEPGYVATVRAAHRVAPDAVFVAVMATAIDGSGAVIDSLVDRMKRLLWPRGQQVALSGDRGLARMMHGQFVYCPAISYRVAKLPQRRFDPRWKQVMDLELFTRVLLDGSVVMLDRSRGYRYRRHSGTTTVANASSFVRLHEETELACHIAAEARERGWRRAEFASRLRWSIRLNGLLSVAGSSSQTWADRRAALRSVFAR
jgi:glycosyltransferase involved in cell wall biosynthesis